MPARRKSPAELLANGSASKHPDRLARAEAAPQPQEPLGAAPMDWPEDRRRCWEEIAGSASWLRRPDRPTVELAASLLAHFRSNGVAGTLPAQIAQLQTALAKLGCSPVDRGKLVVPAPDRTANPFNRFKRSPS